MSTLRFLRFAGPVLFLPVVFFAGMLVEYNNPSTADFQSWAPENEGYALKSLFIGLSFIGAVVIGVIRYLEYDEKRSAIEDEAKLEKGLAAWDVWCAGVFTSDSLVKRREVAGIFMMFRNTPDLIGHELFQWTIVMAHRLVKPGACHSEVRQGTACLNRLIWVAETYGLWSYLLDATTWKLVSPVLKGRMAELNKTQVGKPDFDQLALWFAYDGPPPSPPMDSTKPILPTGTAAAKA